MFVSLAETSHISKWEVGISLSHDKVFHVFYSIKLGMIECLTSEGLTSSNAKEKCFI